MLRAWVFGSAAGWGWDGSSSVAGVVCTKVFVLPGQIVQEPRLGIGYCGKMELQ